MTRTEIEALIASALEPKTDEELSTIEESILSAVADIEEKNELFPELLLLLEKVQTRLNKLEAARQTAQKIIDCAVQTENTSLLAQGYQRLADATFALHEYEQSLQAIELLLPLRREDESSAATAELLHSAALCCYHLSRYSQALQYFEKTVAIHEQRADKIRLAQSIAGKGSVYQSAGDYAHALECFRQALALAEESSNRETISTIYGNIANIYYRLSNLQLAIDYYEKLIAYSSENNTTNVASAFGNIALSYLEMGDADGALDYATRAMLIHERLGNKVGLAAISGTLGNISARRKDTAAALHHFRRALSLHQELGNAGGVALYLGNIGYVHASPDLGDYNPTLAEEYLLKAIQLSQETGNKSYLVNQYDSLGLLYEHEQRWMESLQYYKRHFTLKEELVGEEIRKQATQFHKALEEAEQDKQRAIEKARHDATEQLLHNVLPPMIAEKMIHGSSLIAESFESVSIFFSDIVGFTKISQQVTAEELVMMLNRVFTEFDRLAAQYGLEKVKTIGDAYMAVCGAPLPDAEHSLKMLRFAVDVCQAMAKLEPMQGEQLRMRIGVHCGKVVAGVIGEKKFAYDLWGDAVNTASRMERYGEANKIHASEDFIRELLRINGQLSMDGRQFNVDLSSLTIDHCQLTITPRGEIEIKGKGMMRTYFIEALDGKG